MAASPPTRGLRLAEPLSPLRRARTIRRHRLKARGCGRLDSPLDVLGELNGRPAVDQQAVIALIVSDGLRGLRAHDAVDRARVVAELGEAALHAGDYRRLRACRAVARAISRRRSGPHLDIVNDFLGPFGAARRGKRQV